jgi:hypothetical protein
LPDFDLEDDSEYESKKTAIDMHAVQRERLEKREALKEQEQNELTQGNVGAKPSVNGSLTYPSQNLMHLIEERVMSDENFLEQLLEWCVQEQQRRKTRVDKLGRHYYLSPLPPSVETIPGKDDEAD